MLSQMLRACLGRFDRGKSRFTHLFTPQLEVRVIIEPQTQLGECEM